jgi:hypothetical protein
MSNEQKYPVIIISNGFFTPHQGQNADLGFVYHQVSTQQFTLSQSFQRKAANPIGSVDHMLLQEQERKIAKQQEIRDEKFAEYRDDVIGFKTERLYQKAKKKLNELQDELKQKEQALLESAKDAEPDLCVYDSPSGLIGLYLPAAYGMAISKIGPLPNYVIELNYSGYDVSTKLPSLPNITIKNSKRILQRPIIETKKIKIGNPNVR